VLNLLQLLWQPAHDPVNLDVTMSVSIDLSGEDDVYANIHRDIQSTSAVGLHEIRVVSEAIPTALARIFGLLSTMSVVPFSTSSSVGTDNTVRLSIDLRGIDPSTTDLLLRKIHQLTETLTVTGKAPTDSRDV
jgi:hypothetical protein